jgi:hypothetical protein
VSTDRRERFLAMSAELTAFGTVDLQGSGQTGTYLDLVVRVVGADLLDRVLDAYEQAVRTAGADRDERTRLLQRDLLGDEKLGPVARNVIKLWYVGVWYELPPEWVDVFGALEHDGTFTASAAAYAEGLLWYAIDAHPPGARAPGYGSWAAPPSIPPIDDDPAATADLATLVAATGEMGSR